MIEEQFGSNASVKTQVYQPSEELEQSILHNAISPSQYRQLLKNSKNDCLVTGQITPLESGYLDTAYSVNEQERKSMNVMPAELDGLANQLSRRIE